MKILLTGEPNIGKSTVLLNFINMYKGKMGGFVTLRMVDTYGVNQGFISHTVDGKKKKIIAHKTFINTPFTIGNNYHVDKNAIDEFMVPEIIQTSKNSHRLLIIDELAPMEFLSEKFKNEIKKIMRKDIHILALIVKRNTPETDEIKSMQDIITIEVTEKNRETLVAHLLLVFNNLERIEKLKNNQKSALLKLLRKYLNNSQKIQVEKLINHAVPYLIDNKIKVFKTHYSIYGGHKDHNVNLDLTECDCDLFNGLGKYKKNAGECSHIQAVKLFRSDLVA